MSKEKDLQETASSVQQNGNAEYIFATAAPEVFVKEDGEGYEITFDVPGIGKEDVDLNVENRTLVLRAKNRTAPPEGYECVSAEFEPRHYAVSLALPEHADTSDVKGSVANGILTVKLAKRPELKPRKVEIG